LGDLGEENGIGRTAHTFVLEDSVVVNTADDVVMGDADVLRVEEIAVLTKSTHVFGSSVSFAKTGGSGDAGVLTQVKSISAFFTNQEGRE
jgi:hypothetical protein